MSEDQLSKKERKELDRQDKQTRQTESERSAMMKKVGVGVGLVLIVVGIAWAVKVSRPSADELIDLHPDPVEGLDTATVVVKEYSDFQCPACAGLHPVLQDIREEYAGQIKFQYNDFPLSQHEYASVAAIGAECAFQQDKFFEYHDRLFENQDTWAEAESEDAAVEIFTGYATEVGLDMAAFEICTTGQDAADRVNEDYAEGISLGVNSTPSVFVNGERITEQPFSSTIRTAIDTALGTSAQSPVNAEADSADETESDPVTADNTNATTE